ncbi:hypothetical protein [Gluconobacter oxydans]|uniref:hypothetical protein n=1 Tax=Gluconobacter oxydans TaxID=442 RepID=UPI0012DA84C4|nr:hypothetical protein [Gluconobacter oxydans]
MGKDKDVDLPSLIAGLYEDVANIGLQSARCIYEIKKILQNIDPELKEIFDNGPYANAMDSLLATLEGMSERVKK